MKLVSEDWTLLFVLHTHGRAIYHATGKINLTDEQYADFNQTKNPTKIWIRKNEIRFSNPIKK